MVALLGCERPAKSPESLVLRDDLLGKELIERRLGDVRNGERLWAGCNLATVKGDVVVQCLELGVLVKFNCRDHLGPDHPLSMMIAGSSYTLYCR